MNRKHFLVFVAVGLLGCERVHSNYCEGAPNHNCKDMVDAPIDAAACSSNASCSAPLGVCDVAGSKTCVECTATDHAACVGVEPVCGADQTCHACKAHSECASEVCLPDGSCAAEGDVAYVNGGTGSDVAACTRLAPCKTLSKGLLTTKPKIKVVGVVVESATVPLGALKRDVFGDVGARVAVSVPVPIVVASANTDITFHKVSIGNDPGISPPSCVGINLGTTAKVTMLGGAVFGCQLGVSSASSTGLLTLNGVTVSANIGGGISVSGGTFKIENSIVHHNGTTTSAIGGVSLLTAGTGSVFDFNTVVDNDTSTGTSHAGGVFCDAVGFGANNNIVANNRISGSATQLNSQASGVCSAGTSAVQNDLTGLKFKASGTAPFDYHLQAGSIVIDAASTTSLVDVDVDGDARPQGASKDQGADEYRP